MKVEEEVRDDENEGNEAAELGADRPTGDEPHMAHPEDADLEKPGERSVEVEEPVVEKRTVLEAFVPKHEMTTKHEKRGPGRPKKYG